MNKIFLLLFFSFTILTNAQDATSQEMRIINQDSVNAIVIHTVERTMNPFLESIPEGNLVNYGINDRNEISKITIGRPIGVYNIVDTNLFFTSSWRVPIIINNEYRSLFTVILNDIGECQIVDFGATLLAHEIFNARKYYNIKGLLRVYKLHLDFFISDNNLGELEFQPIPNSDNQRYNFVDVLKMIK